MGGNYDIVLRNTHVHLDIQKTTDLHRQCARHMRGRCARSVLTFWARQLSTRNSKQSDASMFRVCIANPADGVSILECCQVVTTCY
jgi:hypothetical protein